MVIFVYPTEYSYYTVGFVCEILICANYANYRVLSNFNSAVTLAFSFQLTARVTDLCLYSPQLSGL